MAGAQPEPVAVLESPEPASSPPQAGEGFSPQVRRKSAPHRKKKTASGAEAGTTNPDDPAVKRRSSSKKKNRARRSLSEPPAHFSETGEPEVMSRVSSLLVRSFLFFFPFLFHATDTLPLVCRNHRRRIRLVHIIDLSREPLRILKRRHLFSLPQL